MYVYEMLYVTEPFKNSISLPNIKKEWTSSLLKKLYFDICMRIRFNMSPNCSKRNGISRHVAENVDISKPLPKGEFYL